MVIGCCGFVSEAIAARIVKSTMSASPSPDDVPSRRSLVSAATPFLRARSSAFARVIPTSIRPWDRDHGFADAIRLLSSLLTSRSVVGAILE
jgi:hypothetical protein